MSIAHLPSTIAGDDHLLLRGVTLIDGTGGTPITKAELEVRDGRVVYAGPARTAAPEGTVKIGRAHV